MKKTTAGLVGGLAGGTVKIAIDQILFTSGISPVNTVGDFTSLFGISETPVTFNSWLVYIAAAAITGFVISLLLPDSIMINYLAYGVIIGTILWVLMNIVFSISPNATPTWSTGSAGIISDLLTHAIMGTIITYIVLKSNINEKA